MSKATQGRHVAVWGLALGVTVLAGAAACDDGESGETGGGGSAGSATTSTAGSGGLGAGGGAVGGAGGSDLPFAVSPDRILADVATLAAPDMAGRAPATAGNEAALAYVEALFAQLGLQPGGDDAGYRQGFDFEQWGLRAAPALSIDAVAVTSSSDLSVLTYSGSASIDAEMVFVGYGLTVPPFSSSDYGQCPLPTTGYDDYAAVSVAGKVALVMRHGPGDLQAVHDHCPANAACVAEPCLWNFGYKAANAALHGAAAVIFVQDFAHAGGDVPSATLDVSYYDPDVASVFVDRAFVETAVPELASWAAAIEASSAPDSHATGKNAALSVDAGVTNVATANLLGIVPGQDPNLGDEVVVIGGHIDHLGVDVLSGAIYPGADDNASGTAVMMELARGMASGDVVPARTVLFAAWNAEEAGLIGSCEYVSTPAFPIPQTFMAFSLDMVGDGDGSGVDVYNGTEPEYQWLVEAMQLAASADGLTETIAAADPLDASDHVCFDYAGAPAVMISTRGEHDYYHTPDDTVASVSAQNLGAAARVMWATLRMLATGSEPQGLWRPPVPLDEPARPVQALHPWSRLR